MENNQENQCKKCGAYNGEITTDEIKGNCEHNWSNQEKGWIERFREKTKMWDWNTWREEEILEFLSQELDRVRREERLRIRAGIEKINVDYAMKRYAEESTYWMKDEALKATNDLNTKEISPTVSSQDGVSSVE